MSIIEKSIEAAGKDKVKRIQPRPVAASKAKQRSPRRERKTIDWSSKFAQELLGESLTDPLFISQFKQLKHAILQSAFGPLAEHEANSVIITSPLANAGKTFVSMNLAQSLAQERDRNVLLVDTDNIKASLTTALGLRDNEGFFDVLDHPELNIEDVIVPTEIPSLQVIPTGSKYQDSAEILNSRRAKDLIEYLCRADPDRIIIYDAPPLLATSDTPALTDMAGQFLLVVEAGSTKESELNASLEFFSADQTVGLILNKAPRIANSVYGGYYNLYRPDEAD